LGHTDSVVEERAAPWKLTKMGACTSKPAAAPAAAGQPPNKVDDVPPSLPSPSPTAAAYDRMKQVADFLSEVPLFNGFSEEDLKLVSRACTPRTFQKDEVIIQQGEVSEEFFLIMSGDASVHLRTEAGERQVALLKDGDYFGEVALLHESPRAATVKVETTELAALVISRNKFEELKLRHKLVFPCRKAVGAAKFAANPRPEPTPKTPADEELIQQALRANGNIAIFCELSEERMERMIDLMWKEQVPKGSDIIKQGDLNANTFYVVAKGSFEVVGQDKKARQKVLGTCAEGDAFGELALLYLTPRAATVRAKVDSEVWAIDRLSFKQAVFSEASHEKLDEYVKTLGSVQTFATLLQDERVALAKCIVEMEFEEGQEIMKEGEPGDSMFVLCQGEVAVSVKGKEQARLKQEVNPIDFWEARRAQTLSVLGLASEKRVAHMESRIRSKSLGGKAKSMKAAVRANTDGVKKSHGDELRKAVDKVKLGAAMCATKTERLKKEVGALQVFGEKALVSKDERTATVTAINGPVLVLCLDVDSCNVLLGPLEDLLKRSRFGEGSAGRKFGQLYKSDLQTLSLLGAGGFGAVYLVEHTTTHETYALKAISKGYLLQCGMQESVMSEKKILMLVNSPFIIKLYETYTGSQSVYFLMEAALGGELFSTYNRKKIFGSTDHARFYTGGAICAIEYLHCKRIVYRDLKPENLMITNTGLIKMIDMGLAKVVVGKTYTTCGTPDYFAPEILGQSGHNHAVDWWTVGILIFELMTGQPPFQSDDAMQTYAKIKKGIVVAKFPANASAPFRNIVKDLCQQQAEKRLGVACGGVRKIREHPWYEGFSWEDFMACTMTPPYRPSVQGSKDVANFNVNQSDLPRQIQYQDPGTGWDKDFATCLDRPPSAPAPPLGESSVPPAVPKDDAAPAPEADGKAHHAKEKGNEKGKEKEHDKEKEALKDHHAKEPSASAQPSVAKKPKPKEKDKDKDAGKKPKPKVKE